MAQKTDMMQNTADLLSEDIIKLVGFKLEHELFGLNILTVKEIIRMERITRVPKAPFFIEGIIDMRGIIIPVLNLRKRFNINPEKQLEDTNKIIVIEQDEKFVGFIVDSITEVIKLPEKNVEPPPSTIGGVESEYITGVGKLNDLIIILLDVGKILSGLKREPLR